MAPPVPVVRLSQALYVDVPTASRDQAKRRQSRKRSIRDAPSNDSPVSDLGDHATAVRLLLPKNFAEADRLYHLAQSKFHHLPAYDVWTPARHWQAKHGDSPDLHKHLDIYRSVDTDALARVSPPCERDACDMPTPYACTGSLAQTAFVVVESVLGFSAVRDLLEMSHLLGSYQQSTGVLSVDPGSTGHAVDAPPHLRSISEVLGRLILWIDHSLRKKPHGGCHVAGFNEATSSPTSPPRSPWHKLERDDNPHVFPASSSYLPTERSFERRTFELTYARTAFATRHRCERSKACSAFILQSPEPSVPRENQARGVASDGRIDRVVQIVLICHPLVTMAPDIRWCLRLIQQAKSIASLKNANAKLSTLGGGYFLTRQVGQAIRLARAQSEVATALGDFQLARKCRVNEAYNYIWLGDYDRARTIIDTQVAAARDASDDEVENIALIAGRFLRRAKKANERLLLTHVGGTPNGTMCNRPGIDVKTDEWHRVRALPMYSSR